MKALFGLCAVLIAFACTRFWARSMPRACVPADLFALDPEFILSGALVLQLSGYAIVIVPMLRPWLGAVSLAANLSLTILALNAAAILALSYFVMGKKPVLAR